MALRAVNLASRRLGARSFGAAATTPDYIAGAPEAVVTTAGNGVKIASVSTPGETATITAWVDAGSRYESPQTNGVANLFESSTMDAKKAEIAKLGGMISSYTSRE